MCGRYSLAGPNPAQVRAAYPVTEGLAVRQRFNVAPSDDVLAVTTDREGRPRGELLRWGLVPSWARSPSSGLKMINARAETLAERPAYKRPFERMRCLIIADGFYEWQRDADGRKQPFHITVPDRPVFAFAGLWSIWHPPEGEPLRTCTIITTAASEAVAPLHDRMPVILPREAERPWLDRARDPAELRELLAGSEEDLVLRPVGSAVNDARYDGPECLAEPVQAQVSLF